MRKIFVAIGFAMAFLASAQNSTVLTFAHTEGMQNMNEIATVIRTIADVKEIQVNEAARTAKLSSGPEQLKLAEWIFGLLDTPDPASAAKYEFQATGDENIVHLYFLKTPATVQSFQEMVTSIRTVADIRRVFTYNAPKAVVARGTADQIALADWLVSEMDQPSTAHTSAAHEYHMTSGFTHDESDVRLFYLAHTATVRDFQEVASAVRNVGEIRRVFTYNDPRALVVRSTPDEIRLAAWLVDQLDTLNTGQPRQASPTYTFIAPYRDDGPAIRVFFLNHAGSVDDFKKAALQVHNAAQIRRNVATYIAPRAIVVRGTTDQLAVAEQLVKDIQ